MRKIIAFELALLILFLSHPVSAEEPTDIGAKVIKRGLDMFGKSVGDSFYELVPDNNTGNNTAPGNSSSSLVKVISYTIDPYSLKFVQDWILISLVGYVVIAVVALMIDATRFSNGSISYRQMSSNVILSGIVPAAVSFGNYMLLVINYVVSTFIVSYGLIMNPISASNITAYVCMGLIILLLSIIMMIRNIIIVFITAASLIFAALYRMPDMDEYIYGKFKKYTAIVFLQPYLLLLMVLGISFLGLLPQIGFGNVQGIGSIALGVLLLWEALSIMRGKGLIMLFIYRAALKGVIKK